MTRPALQRRIAAAESQALATSARRAETAIQNIPQARKEEIHRLADEANREACDYDAYSTFLKSLTLAELYWFRDDRPLYAREQAKLIPLEHVQKLISTEIPIYNRSDAELEAIINYEGADLDLLDDKTLQNQPELIR